MKSRMRSVIQWARGEVDRVTSTIKRRNDPLYNPLVMYVGDSVSGCIMIEAENDLPKHASHLADILIHHFQSESVMLNGLMYAFHSDTVGHPIAHQTHGKKTHLLFHVFTPSTPDILIRFCYMVIYHDDLTENMVYITSINDCPSIPSDVMNPLCSNPFFTCQIP